MTNNFCFIYYQHKIDIKFSLKIEIIKEKYEF